MGEGLRQFFLVMEARVFALGGTWAKKKNHQKEKAVKVFLDMLSQIVIMLNLAAVKRAPE
ncbi:MAG: hypothetical protein HY955_01695 [Deltaproteobacteria bacterium]|nr:hypothetical protein [Deltaproteobacteria bacterium]